MVASSSAVSVARRSVVAAVRWMGEGVVKACADARTAAADTAVRDFILRW